MPEAWKRIEIDYAQRLMAASRAERRALYREANAAVTALRSAALSDDPAAHRIGTSRAMVRFLQRLCRPHETVLEIGCGSGYTLWKLAPRVRRIVGIDVDGERVAFTRELIRKKGIANAEVRQASADELDAIFAPGTFDRLISVDMYEHLHPDDAEIHLRQAFDLLRPGGEYVVVTANRLSGPSDITRDVHPEAETAMGFHLNETTYAELSARLRAIGFRRLRAAWRAPKLLPAAFHLFMPLFAALSLEKTYAGIRRNSMLWRLLEPFVSITLIARK